MKIQAALMTSNSPYAEVRAVVSNQDDPTMPCSTIRAWLIGTTFCIAACFVHAFFDIRQPPISVGAAVPQLLAYPLGTLLARVLPDWGLTVCGIRHSLNPGPFTAKEHMLVTIMASVGVGVPFTNYIVWIQALPQYFGQTWAVGVGYQVLVALSTNFIGYGLAGLCRRFLVYPASCVWPSSLVTIALNAAFHGTTNQQDDGNVANTGPRWSRLRFFSAAAVAMFVYFWLPNSFFKALSLLSWITWISPNNIHLTLIAGVEKGMGINPLPTLDWNRLASLNDPFVLPLFTTINKCVGCALGCLLILGVYYTDTYHTAHLPINSALPFDNKGKRYNVSAILDDRGVFDPVKYQAYSPPYLSAAKVCIYAAFFAMYSATVTYGALYHWREMVVGYRGMARSAGTAFNRCRLFFSKSSKLVQVADEEQEDPLHRLDVHNRLMRAYPEVPEWWYTVILLAAAGLGCTGLTLYPTNTTPLVVLFGLALCFILIVPVGLILAMTGTEVPLNVLAQFIGGSLAGGNAIAMCYFKAYGYVTCAQALHMAADLKLAHYAKVPPRLAFAAQMVPALISTLVCVGVMQYQLRLPNVCSSSTSIDQKAPFRFTCPGPNRFFTAAVLWGTVGPRRMWGSGGLYAATLVGFPLGALTVLVVWYLGRRYPRSALVRSIHPVVLFNGALFFAPWNLSHVWPAVPVAACSWLYVRARHLTLWSRYNYVLAAALSAGIALSALVQFFALSSLEGGGGGGLDWWGNRITAVGCEGKDCVLKTLKGGEYFGPAPGTYN